MAEPTALDLWAHARIQTVPLPSGAGRVKFKALDLTEAVVSGQIPNPLRPVALKAEAGALSRADMDEDEAKAYLELQCFVVAHAVLEFRPKKGKPFPGPLDPDWVRDSMPPMDRDNLWARATHVLTQEALLGVMNLGGFRRRAERDEPVAGGEGDGDAA